MVGAALARAGHGASPDAPARRRLDAWVAADADAGPDAASPSAPARAAGTTARPTGPAPPTGSQFRTRGTVTRLRAYYLWSRVAAPRRCGRVATTAQPPIVLALRLGARTRRSCARSRSIAPALRLAIVHHTVNTNAYTRGPGAGDRARDRDLPREGERLERHRLQLPDRPLRHGLRGPRRRDRPERDRRARRGLQHRLGRRRADRHVQLAPAPTAAQRQALVDLLAWRLDVAHVDPLSIVATTSLGNPRFRARRAGHAARDLRPPRHVLHRLPRHRRSTAQLPSIAAAVAQTGLPKIYAPTVSGVLAGGRALPRAALVARRLDGRRSPTRRAPSSRSGNGHRHEGRLDVGRAAARGPLPLVDRRRAGARPRPACSVGRRCRSRPRRRCAASPPRRPS